MKTALQKLQAEIQDLAYRVAVYQIVGALWSTAGVVYNYKDYYARNSFFNRVFGAGSILGYHSAKISSR